MRDAGVAFAPLACRLARRRTVGDKCALRQGDPFIGLPPIRSAPPKVPGCMMAGRKQRRPHFGQDSPDREIRHEIAPDKRRLDARLKISRSDSLGLRQERLAMLLLDQTGALPETGQLVRAVAHRRAVLRCYGTISGWAARKPRDSMTCARSTFAVARSSG